jgi:hypothetical protein
MSNKLGDFLEEAAKKKNEAENVKQEAKPEEVKENVQDEIIEKVVEETSQEVTEETQDEVVEPVQEEKPTVNEEFDFFKLASEKLGKEIKSLEDLVIKEEVVKEVDYASDFSREYDKFYKETGGSIQDFQFVQEKFEEKPKEDIVKAILRKENPTLSSKQIELLFDAKYKFDEDEDNERDIELKKIYLEQDYNKSLSQLKGIQEKYKLPQQKAATNEAELRLQQEEAFRQQQVVWENTVKESNKELTGLDIKLGDLKFTHNIPDDKKVYVRDVTSDATMAKWLQKYSKGEGQLDVKQIQYDTYIRDNFQSILEDVAKNVEATTLERIAKEDKSINFSSDSKAKVETKADKDWAVREELLKGIYKKIK